ncbi:hypothetical protein EYF80_037516 [Liparis tanakae]|uniref:Uncharacterized protein n=1 Tax=Liparis tanakae TaxID=230148 RepID=A0A4Z2GFV9_9TELE|nr:hypothetical protein EYF80_037516 [Liparis tanakae]
MRFPIGLLASGRLVRPQAEPSQEEQPKVEEYGVSVPPIGEAPDQRQGVHGPIEAERVRAKEEPKVDGRQGDPAWIYEALLKNSQVASLAEVAAHKTPPFKLSERTPEESLEEKPPLLSEATGHHKLGAICMGGPKGFPKRQRSASPFIPPFMARFVRRLLILQSSFVPAAARPAVPKKGDEAARVFRVSVHAPLKVLTRSCHGSHASSYLAPRQADMTPPP